MGFISGTSTVTVQAKLTDAGKKKMYESMQNGNSGFVEKFAIGDSDTNYVAIDAGGSVLQSGHVPEATGFRPTFRSFALYKGMYHPGTPVILIDKDYGGDNGIFRKLSIGGINSASNKQIYILFDVTTEWPKDEPFIETYKFEVQNPGNMTDDVLSKMFTTFYHGSAQKTAFMVTGPLSIDQLSLIYGESGSGNGTTVPVKITGLVSNAQITYNIMLVQ